MMAEIVNTNVEALYEILDSLHQFQENIAPLQGELQRVFHEIDEQINEGIKRELRKVEIRQQMREQKSQMEAFYCCDTEQIHSDEETLEQMRKVILEYQQQKEVFFQLFNSFFSSEAASVDRGCYTLERCIAILEQYLGINIASNQPSKGYVKRKKY